MKFQKLGFVVGVNMVVACSFLQGCKATKNTVASNDVPQVDTTVIAPVAPEPTPAPVEPVAPAPITVESLLPTTPEPAAPSQVKNVKPVRTTPAQPQASTSVAVPPTPAPAPAPEGVVGSTYVVKKGDTLFLISKRNNVKLSALKKANPGLKPDRIRIGQKLTIPGVAAPASAHVEAPAHGTVAPVASPLAANVTAPAKAKAVAPYTGETKEYIVKSGDSLGLIAQKYGTRIRTLKELNGLATNALQVGQTLKVPAQKDEKVQVKNAKTAPAEKKSHKKAEKTDEVKGKAPAPAPAAAAEVKPEEAPVVPAVEAPVTQAVPAAVSAPAPAATEEGPTYQVKEGDDIISVAVAWGLSPSNLMDLNNIKVGESLRPGQILKLPANAKMSTQE